MTTFINKLKKSLGPNFVKVLAVTGILALLYLLYVWVHKEKRMRKS